MLNAPLLLLVGYGLLIVVSFFWWFVRLEREGRTKTTVLLILWLLVIESALYENPNQVPRGLFHPGIGADPDPDDANIDYALSFRLPDLIAPVALGAHLYARRLPERIRLSSVWFFAFFVWLAAAALIGLYNANSPGLIAFEFKAIGYLAVFVLAASVPVREYTEGRALYRLIYGSAAIAALLILTDGLNLSLSLDIPLLPLPNVGQLGTDTAGIFIAIGVLAVALALYQEHDRFRLFAAAGPLLLSPAVAGQRASIMALGVSLLVLAVGTVLSPRRRKATPTELALLAVFALLLASLPPMANLVRGAPEAKVPFETSFEYTFRSRAKQQSAQSRLNQWRKAGELIEERPVTGWGLGKTYTHYDAGRYQFFETNFTHNIVGDLLLRTGLIGVVLFIVAMTLLVAEGLGAWRRQPDDLAAVLALAGVAIIFGLLARGMVESLFEKFRLATLLGIMIGIVGSAVVARVRGRAPQPLPRLGEAWSSGISSAR